MDNLEFLLAWMSTPNPQFGMATPLEMMERGRGKALAHLIRQAIEDEEAAQIEKARIMANGGAPE